MMEMDLQSLTAKRRYSVRELENIKHLIKKESSLKG